MVHFTNTLCSRSERILEIRDTVWMTSGGLKRLVVVRKGLTCKVSAHS